MTVTTSQDNVKNDKKMDYLIEIEGLKKYFPISSSLFGKKVQSIKAVDDISFHLRKGETLGLVGESGCGKSTTGNMILRLIEPTEGKVFFEGQDLLQLSAGQMQKVRKDIQMIFQDPFSSLNPRMKVFDIIAEPLKAHNIAKGKKLENMIYDLIETVGLNRDVAKRYPHEFSGGQRQRIGIARAIALKPKLIICDEPVSALDVSIQAQILNLLIDLQKKFDLTFIFIGHGIPAVKYISDRIAVMYMGEIVELASREELFGNTMHPYTQGLISAVPIPNPRLRENDDRLILENDVPNQIDLPKGCRFYSRCPFGQKKCIEEKPEFREVSKDHYVSCHFPLN